MLAKEASANDGGLLLAFKVMKFRLNADEWCFLLAIPSPNTSGAEALSAVARSIFYAGARTPYFTLVG